MHLINGNKLNGSHLSKCVSDILVAPLFAFAKWVVYCIDKMSILYQGQTMGKVYMGPSFGYVER
jgi:hypothetical protein